MREEIITLIAQAENNVTNFEKEVFINYRGFYINAKTLIDDMIEQIGIIKKTAELEDYTQEIYNANKGDLTFIISTINQLRELVQTKTIHVIVEGKGNYRVQVLGEREIAIDTKEKNITDVANLVPEVQQNIEVQPNISKKDVILDESAIDDFLNSN